MQRGDVRTYESRIVRRHGIDTRDIQVRRFFIALVMVTAFWAGPAHAYTWPARTAMVHLFEWKWSDIALECENYLGPSGYAAVQVSPPSEHRIIGPENPFGAAYPWWQRYQPVGFTVTNSRSGTRAEFADMVSRCAAVGVDIYVDVVINHTTGDPGQTGGTCIGSNGTTCGYRSVSGLFGFQDYHEDCPIDGGSQFSIQNCWLSGLADLKTESTYVQNVLRGYMNDLVSLGVQGIRVDAAKHIQNTQVDWIVDAFDEGKTGRYTFLEVIADPVSPLSDYTGVGDVTEFQWANKIKEAFDSQIWWLNNNGGIGSANWGFVDGSSAVIFVENHDEERIGGSLSYKDGAKYALGVVFTLAHGYGYPKIMSSYTFSDSSVGPPGSNGQTSSVYTSPTTDTCGQGGWLCQHRWPAAAGMVGFRNHVAGEPLTGWTVHSDNHISFRRGNKGFVSINREGNARSLNIATGLPDGQYCDVANDTFDYDARTCSGTPYSISGGALNTSINSNGAIALHVDARVGSVGGSASVAFTCLNGDTYFGQSVYVVGNIPELGSWSIQNSATQKLDPNNYPTWDGTVAVPANTAIEWKCVKANESNTSVIEEWQSGGNNAVTSGGAGSTVGSTGGF